MKSNKTRWIVVAGIAAGIATVTTVVILLLNARSRKKEWFDDEGAFEFDEDDVYFPEDEETPESVDEAD